MNIIKLIISECMIIKFIHSLFKFNRKIQNTIKYKITISISRNIHYLFFSRIFLIIIIFPVFIIYIAPVF